MMFFSRTAAVAHATTALFVLLWSSGAIVSKLGLAYASPFAFLLVRFLIALLAVLAVTKWAALSPPDRWAARWLAVVTGLVLLGSYQIFYLLALDLQVTPGGMATVLGVQPILTAVLLERKALRPPRLFGLLLGLAGLVLVVYQSIGVGGLSGAGVGCALLALRVSPLAPCCKNVFRAIHCAPCLCSTLPAWRFVRSSRQRSRWT